MATITVSLASAKVTTTSYKQLKNNDRRGSGRFASLSNRTWQESIFAAVIAKSDMVTYCTEIMCSLIPTRADFL